MNVGEDDFVSRLYLIPAICDGDSEYGMQEIAKKCERAGLDGFGDELCVVGGVVLK